MMLKNFRSDFSPYFDRRDKGDRVIIPNNVKLVIGTDVFNCSGSILAQHSTVFLDMIQKQAELYLDEFSDCLEGLLDGIDLLYGAEVTLSLQNIQPILKFSLMYKVEGVFEACMQWVKKELSIDNIFTFCRIGLFMKSVEVDCEDVLRSCKGFILMSKADELLDVSKTWQEDDNVINFLFDKEMLSVTLPTVTNWVNTESKVVTVLDNIDGCELEETLYKLSQPSLQLMEKMQDVCESLSSCKRICKLSVVIGKNQLYLEKLILQIQFDSTSVVRALEPKLWRNFNYHQILSLHLHFKIADFFFAEILLDWISFTKPLEADFDNLWEVVVESNMICDDYVNVLRASAMMTNANFMIPMPEKSIKYEYMIDPFENSSSIVDKLSNCMNLPLNDDCHIMGCPSLSVHFYTFKLSKSIPCYQLGLEDGDKYDLMAHYHHDKIKHWYATEEKNGERVLLSFVTNTMAEVVEKVKASKNIHLHNLLEIVS